MIKEVAYLYLSLSLELGGKQRNNADIAVGVNPWLDFIPGWALWKVLLVG